MEAVIGNVGITFARPAWLLAAVLIVPAVWLAVRSLGSLNRGRRVAAIALRVLVLGLLSAILAEALWTRRSEDLTVITVLDRSLSIPQGLQEAALDYLSQAARDKKRTDLLGSVDVAEQATIAKLPAGDANIPRRNTILNGGQSRLADGIQMAMAIAPPQTGVRIILASEGNQTAGNLKEAAKVAQSNGIPIDVLPLRYNYDREVLVRRLSAPVQARSNQTVSLRMVLESTGTAGGQVVLYCNGRPVDLDPQGPEVGARVLLQPGTQVKTVSVPVGSRGAHLFDMRFVPDDPNDDRIQANDRATAMTFVAGPGHILIADADGESAARVAGLLSDTNVDIRTCSARELPTDLAQLMDTDAVFLVDTGADALSFHQHQILAKYVTDLGGGLIMVGGPNSYGAGGWIGSPVAEILPVDVDPPQKKQIPKGALVLIMHACEMPDGNYWGKQVAACAVKTLSRLDLVGVMSYQWMGGSEGWVYPLSEVGDRSGVLGAIDQMQMGDLPDLGPLLQGAYDALKDCKAGAKHVIVISDGDPQPPTQSLLSEMKDAGITCTGVGIFPHNPQSVNSLRWIAEQTGGRFYDVVDETALPQIFIKEAQTVKRALIVDKTFTPTVSFGLSEVLAGLPRDLPSLDGYVLTGPKQGLAQQVLVGPEGDPILATCQSGLGRVVALTTSLDRRWASQWLAWPGVRRFTEQAMRWAARPAQSTDVEVLVDVQGTQVDVHAEAADPNTALALSGMEGRLIGPDLSGAQLDLDQVGPGQFHGRFEAAEAGSYVVNLRYRPRPDGPVRAFQAAVTIPCAVEFSELADNTALLKEAADATGGRILNSDPNQADLFAREAVTFPSAQRSLVYPLMIAWVVVFLLDVAVRRVAVDFRGTLRKVRQALAGRKAEDQGPQTLDRLRQMRQKVHAGLSRPAADAGRKYEAGRADTGPLLTTKDDRPDPAKAKATPTVQGGATQAGPESHIDHLLKAKRKAHGGDGTEAGR